MRRIRILSVIIFLMALAVYGGSRFYDWRNGDDAGPEIIMEEGTETIIVSAFAEEGALLAGIRAEDEKDGDVTDSLIIESMSNFIEKGRRTITVAAFDSDNHVTKASREVVYSDYHSPRFSLSQPLKFPAETQNILDGLKAEDVLDGDITGNIKISTEYTLNVSVAGEYPVEFIVSNSAGDVAKLPVTIQIYDVAEENASPQIMLSQYLVYTSVGTPVEPWEYVCRISMGGTEYIKEEDGVLRDSENMQEETSICEDEVSIKGEIDYNTPGVYEIVYQITSENGRTGTVRLIVVVSE